MSKQAVCESSQKSTFLLLLILFFLFNAAMLFRAAVNSLYFMEDPGKDYSEITATVTALLPENNPAAHEKAFITPVFSFSYQGEPMTREAPALHYPQLDKPPAYQMGDEVLLWINNYRGEIILPPPLSQKDTGISQLMISFLSFVLAMVLWKVRNLLAKRKATEIVC
ncbi:MAG: hypothetical protein KJ804_15860 [Proteobacteria bacterium]|nr:hypothetical protein [Pseudomonadota bacterium]MBU1059788.1 hypothetical protein [Pseudomonadota bacterium]